MSSSKLQTSDGLVLNVGIDVSPNEPILNHTLNRGSEKLLNNDLALYEVYKKILNQLTISDYNSNAVYDVGDLVWFRDGNYDLYLLKNVLPENTTEPNPDNFPKSGWSNENEYINILDYGIESLLSSKIEAVLKTHREDKQYHPFGKINIDNPSSPDYITRKLLQKDLNNLDSKRSTTFFPTRVEKLDVGDVITNGYMRKYDTGLLEYDITFKLGSEDSDLETKRVFFGSNQLSANIIEFKKYTGISKAHISYQENSKYFFNTSHMQIFKYDNSDSLSSTAQVGISEQANRNDFVNTYSATINFPEVFADRNYMIFGSQILNQTVNKDSKKAVPSANDLTFCGKTRENITVLDITFPDSTKYMVDGYNAKNGGLISNSFHCHIIGMASRNG